MPAQPFPNDDVDQDSRRDAPAFGGVDASLASVSRAQARTAEGEGVDSAGSAPSTSSAQSPEGYQRSRYRPFGLFAAIRPPWLRDDEDPTKPLWRPSDGWSEPGWPDQGRTGDSYPETREAEAWLRENDPKYEVQSKRWRHVRRGNGFYRTPSEPIINPDEFAGGYVSPEDYVIEKSSLISIGDQDRHDAELASRISHLLLSQSFVVWSNRKRVRRVRKVYRLQRDEAIVREHEEGKSFREIGKMFDVSHEAARKVVEKVKQPQLDRMEDKLDTILTRVPGPVEEAQQFLADAAAEESLDDGDDSA